MISKEEVMRFLNYDKHTGVFTWLVNKGRAKVGTEAGNVEIRNGKPYRVIKINGKRHYAHRLSWLILTGSFPDEEIDHIDGNGVNNSASNLRAVSGAENHKNRRKQSNNMSGVCGVHWCKRDRKWYAKMKINNKHIHLGLFDNLEDAISVRKTAEIVYGFHENHGIKRPL